MPPLPFGLPAFRRSQAVAVAETKSAHSGVGPSQQHLDMARLEGLRAQLAEYGIKTDGARKTLVELGAKAGTPDFESQYGKVSGALTLTIQGIESTRKEIDKEVRRVMESYHAASASASASASAGSRAQASVVWGKPDDAAKERIVMRACQLVEADMRASKNFTSFQYHKVPSLVEAAAKAEMAWDLALKRVAKFKDPAKQEAALAVQATLFQQHHARTEDFDVIKASLKKAFEAQSLHR